MPMSASAAGGLQDPAGARGELGDSQVSRPGDREGGADQQGEGAGVGAVIDAGRVTERGRRGLPISIAEAAAAARMSVISVLRRA